MNVERSLQFFGKVAYVDKRWLAPGDKSRILRRPGQGITEVVVTQKGVEVTSSHEGKSGGASITTSKDLPKVGSKLTIKRFPGVKRVFTRVK